MMQLKKAPIQLMHPRRLLTGAFRAAVPVGMALCGLVNWNQAAIAEGSRELVQNGGNRPFTEWRTNTTGGILRRTVLKVYANAGEVINLGSSGVGVGSGDILLFDSTANVDTSTPLLDCKTTQPTKGVLDTRAKEIAGPLPASGGYTPCTFAVTTSGVYQVIFYGPDGSMGITDPTTAGSVDYIANPLINANQKSTVSMWDITVTNSGAVQTGRVFTDYIALIMGANARYLKSNLYILTQDGYRYLTDLNKGSGLDPNGFIFFANSQGLLDIANKPIYRTGMKAGTDNSMAPPLDGGVQIQPPVHKLFFSPPDNTAISALGIPLTAIAPVPASNFMFTGGTGGSGNQTPKGVGGTFSFNAPQDGSYQIVIDTNNNGSFKAADGDRILEGKATAGFNTVAWDGKDGAGAVLPPLPGNAPYSARIILRGGEYHFPLLDAESNSGGFEIQMLNPPGAFSNGANTTTVYFDERNYTTNGTNVALNCSSPSVPVCDARDGIDSATGTHKYGSMGNNPSDYGDKKAIDTWIYFPSQATYAPLIITTTNQANVQGKKSVKFLTDNDGDGKVTVGDRVEYTITYSNATPVATSDATNFVISDTLPSQLTFVSASIVSQTAGNTIVLNPSYGGSGALTNMSTLRKGDTITIKIVATINNDNGGSPISNQASATFSTPDNAGTTGTVITDADAAGATVNPPAVGNFFFQTADNGINTGNDPVNTADDDPTLITVVASSPKPNLRLAKRVTKIQGTLLSNYIDVVSGTGAADDNALYWANPSVTATKSDNSGTTPNFSALLQGAIDTNALPSAQKPKPADEVEYTIYFLSDGTKDASSVSLCDFLPVNTTYVAGTTQLVLGTNSPVTITDSTASDSDGGYYTSGFPAACTGTNNGVGAIVVNIGTVLRATAAGTPTTSYGLIRFRAKIN
jgi:fimbrial isopeptide formation D2 family protein/uncharacterized repeat protein (TIGR01451 family)